MSYLTSFHKSIDGADRLIAMYGELRQSRDLGVRGRLDANNVDLLWLPRAAVVASLAALDAYVHDVVEDRIPAVLKGGGVPQAMCDRLGELFRISDGTGFRKQLPLILDADVPGALSRRLTSTLSFESFQSSKKIKSAYELIAVRDIFGEVARRWRGPGTAKEDIASRLDAFFQRRNKIAHEGDIEANGTPRAMQPQYAKDCRDFVANLAVRLDAIVYGP